MTDPTTRPVRAETRIALSEPEAVLRQLLDHLGEHGRVIDTADDPRVEFDFGTARARIDGKAIDVRLEAPDTTSLAYLQMGLAEHLKDKTDVEALVWRGANQSGGPLPYFRELRVVETKDVTALMRRITFAGADLARFSYGGMHMRLLFPAFDGQVPVWPTLGADGHPVWPDAEERPLARVYTIRSIDVAAGLIDVDFVLHEDDCIGGRWAARAQPGGIVGMTGPGGGEAPSARWLLLAGDETALPAIGRTLETLPAETTAVVRIEIADAAEKQDLETNAALDLQWLCRNGEAPGTTTLLADAVKEVVFPTDEDDVFAWVAGEYRTFKEIRGFLRKERNLPRDKHLVVAYWRRGVAG
jgi:NADPH-dependent ferric siderophore reductase